MPGLEGFRRLLFFRLARKQTHKENWFSIERDQWILLLTSSSDHVKNKCVTSEPRSSESL